MASEIAPEEIVNVLYRAALRRAPDDAGLTTYVRLLNDGMSEVELLNLLMESAEFRENVLMSASGKAYPASIDDYRLENDQVINQFTTNKVRKFTATIRKNSVDINEFARVSTESLDYIVSYNREFGDSQRDYFEYHERRFHEIAGAVKAIIEEKKDGWHPAILDFGFSINSHILRRLFSDVTLGIADRPQIWPHVSPPVGEFDGVFSVDLSVDNIDEIDLEKKFDIIVFSEVIEHVMINPAKILRFLLRQLTETGHAVVTTPNLFSRDKLKLISERKNPLPAYPINYGRAEAPHFHVREYCMSEMLSMIKAAGGRIQSFFFSDCWDSFNERGDISDHELGNMFFVFGK
jgi:SAM-dependent methyltransferase